MNMQTTKLFKPLALCLTLSLAGCVTSNSLNQQSAQMYEKHIAELNSQKKVDRTSKTAKRIQAVFKRLKPHAEADNQTGTQLNWELHVVKSDELNAWAMAGGKMVVYTGIVDKLKLTNDEIATIVGHEMAHVLLEHGKKRANLELWVGIASSVGGAALGGAIGDEELGNAIAGGVKDITVSNPYSRSNEKDADELGLMLMAKAGYNPEAAPTLWQKMTKEQGEDNAFLRLLSTHPSGEDREANLRALIPQAKALQSKSTK